MMGKLILTAGLPRSGKTTWAKTTGWPIVNPDSVRIGLHGQRFFGPAEAFVWAISYLMVEALFRAGHKTVVVDATNVSEKRRLEWYRRFENVELHVIDTLPSECLRRAQAENDTVIQPIICKMADEWDLHKPEGWNDHKTEGGG